jgi:Ca-activated chloride channel family protein
MPASAQNDAAAASAPSEADTISVRTSIVAITTLVRDKQGELVRDLNKEDFHVKEDGKPIDIRYFDKDSDLPLQIGLLIDTSGSQQKFFEEQRKAGGVFLTSMLTRPQDQAYVVRFDSNILLLQKMTPDVEKLKQSLTLLGKYFPLQPGADARKNTRLYDALCSATMNVAKRERGRRAIIVLTDGDDNGSSVSLPIAIQQVQRADTAVYTIFYTERDAETATQRLLRTSGHAASNNGRGVMELISAASGGRVFDVSKDMPVEKIFQQIEYDMRQQYRIGYSPKQATPGSYHKLEVKTTNKNYVVQARVGYYTPQ